MLLLAHCSCQLMSMNSVVYTVPVRPVPAGPVEVQNFKCIEPGLIQ